MKYGNHPENLSAHGPTPVDPNEIRRDIALDRMVVAGTASSTVLLGAVDIIGLPPLAVEAMANSDIVEFVGVSVLATTLAGLAIGCAYIAQETRQHLQQLRITQQRSSIVQRGGFPASPEHEDNS